MVIQLLHFLQSMDEINIVKQSSCFLVIVQLFWRKNVEQFSKLFTLKITLPYDLEITHILVQIAIFLKYTISVSSYFYHSKRDASLENKVHIGWFLNSKYQLFDCTGFLQWFLAPYKLMFHNYHRLAWYHIISGNLIRNRLSLKSNNLHLIIRW